MEHKILLKCRTCLQECDENDMYELFGIEEDGKSRRFKLYDKVQYCCGVRIRDSHNMPSKICERCFDMTRMWFNFRQMCVNSQVYLESLCIDREKPVEIADATDSEYLEYLYEDLQMQRDQIVDDSSRDEEFISNDGDYYSEPEHIDANDFDETSMHQKECSDIEEDFRNDEESFKKENSTTSKNKTNNRYKKSSSSKAVIKERVPSPSSYMCNICGNVYTKKSAFNYHMKQHANIKPHDCEICGKNFRQVCELRNHMRRHTGEKPYKCNYCDRHFIDRSERHRHERVHTNTRPYVCSVCGKSFMYSAILKNHSKMHSGEKDFNCLVCEKAFTLQHQLKAHLQTIIHKQKEAQFISSGYEVVFE